MSKVIENNDSGDNVEESEELSLWMAPPVNDNENIKSVFAEFKDKLPDFSFAKVEDENDEASCDDLDSSKIFNEPEEMDAIDFKSRFQSLRKERKEKKDHYRLARWLKIDEDLDIERARIKNDLAELAEEKEREEARKRMSDWSQNLLGGTKEFLPGNFVEEIAGDLVDSDILDDDISGEDDTEL